MGAQQRELRALGEGEIAPRERRRGRSEVRRRHATRVAKPSCPDHLGDPRIRDGGLGVEAPRNRRPEAPPVLTPPDGRAPR